MLHTQGPSLEERYCKTKANGTVSVALLCSVFNTALPVQTGIQPDAPTLGVLIECRLEMDLVMLHPVKPVLRYLREGLNFSN